MSIRNLSLYGLKEYVVNEKKGLHNTPDNRHLQDLKDMVNDMCSVRNGSLSEKGCSCHGNEVDRRYYSSKTGCSSHHISSYNRTTLSLGELCEVIEALRPCSCNSVTKKDCDCVSRCTCNGRCDCVDRCSCVGRCRCTGNCNCNSYVPTNNN